eukprot:CCRYP_001368-RA/>CCRYP_001368-RA protein AED:0.24 eAED:0.47 QI:0/0/0/1/1/1/2/0/781
MSAEKMALIGLKNQECERGRGGKKAPIRYVQDRDPVQEALDLKPETLKCTIANGSETRVMVWSGHGINEQFVLHMNKAYITAKKMGLIPTCDDAERAYASKKGDWKAVLRELADDPLSKTEKEKKTTESLSLKADMLALRTKMTDSALEVFQLYANLLTEEACQPCDLIVKEPTESSPFHDIFRVERKKSPGKMSESFRRCQLLHLQSCFAHDAGKNLKFYISNCLKKPNKVQVHQFVQCVMRLNNYVEDLPCLYYSPSASTMTQQVYSFTDAELACHILRMCPLKWQDQYHLLEKCYPKGVKPLLLILERIEVAHPVDERQLSSKPAKAQGAEQPSKKFALGARIPKKPKQARTEYTLVDKNLGKCGHTKQSKLLKVRKKPWKWTEEHQKALVDIKATIAKDVSLAYPDYSKGFEIYTDGSKRQLGAVITQNNRPIAFVSTKLSVCQQKYSVTEIELLAIVETLKEFKGMLWGQPIVVYTDHKNLMQDALGLTCDRVYRWRLLLEEYGPEIVYIKGIHNTVADAISCLDFGPTKDVKENWTTFTKCWCYYTMQAEDDPSPVKHSDLMNYVFANPSEEKAIYPLTVREIAAAQQTDKTLDKLSLLEAYKPQLVENVQVLCKDGKLVIPQELQQRAVQWYHHYLQHPGTTRLKETLRAAMYWKGLRHSVRTFVKNCHKCQVNKRRQHKYGKLPTKLVVSNPWEVLCVDLIGPYTLKGKDSTEIDFMCVTMIDSATSWFEIVEQPVTEFNSVTPKGKRASRVLTHIINLKKHTLINHQHKLAL